MAGDKTALDHLYAKYAPALYGSVIHILRSQAHTAEILLDTFLNCWTRIHSYDPGKGRLFTWMLQIARSQAISCLRSKSLQQEKRARTLAESGGRQSGKGWYEISVDDSGLKEILANLPDEQSVIIGCLYFGGYTLTELAAEFDIPPEAVRIRLRLALTQLRLMASIT